MRLRVKKDGTTHGPPKWTTSIQENRGLRDPLRRRGLQTFSNVRVYCSGSVLAAPAVLGLLSRLVDERVDGSRRAQRGCIGFDGALIIHERETLTLNVRAGSRKVPVDVPLDPWLDGVTID